MQSLSKSTDSSGDHWQIDMGRAPDEAFLHARPGPSIALHSSTKRREST